MGGHVFPNLTRRINSAEMTAVLPHLLNQLRDHFPWLLFEVIPWYREKQTFGDLDLLVNTPYNSEQGLQLNNWLQQHPEVEDSRHQPHDMVRSLAWHPLDDSLGNDRLQVDLIHTRPDTFQTALKYFSWNDLGNLMGRTAHRMGFKYGFDGLILPLRDGSHQFADIVVSTNTEEIYGFLGYDYGAFLKGFDNPEAIYRFVASGELFSPTLFHLENTSHRNRTRDSKRPTYHGLLAWLEKENPDSHHDWVAHEDMVGREEERGGFLQRAFQHFQLLKWQICQAENELQFEKNAKALLNGAQVSEWIGLEGCDLGMFMAVIKRRLEEDGSRWQDKVTDMGADIVKSFVQQIADEKLGTKQQP